VGVAGATVSYTGTSSGSVVSGVGGAYTITNLASGTYTITPTLAGYTFVPTSSSQAYSGNSLVGINFTAQASGSSVYSQPDCRQFGNFPNDYINVQGTLTYTVQVFESRVAGAPVDSRVAGAPVDSRVSAPQNSRTPGTFGPDE
jgi:hypothetical protein